MQTSLNLPLQFERKTTKKTLNPASYSSLMASFERYLKKKNYGFSIMKDAEFEQAYKALQSKQKDLKQKGKRKLTLHLLSTTRSTSVFVGVRSTGMCVGVTCNYSKLQVIFGETNSNSKTRTGENPRDVRQIKPKMFSVLGSEKDPVAAYKLYAKKRLTEMNDSYGPFYLAVNNCTKQESSQPWFKTSAVGENKLNSLMRKTWQEKPDLDRMRKIIAVAKP